MTARNGLVNRSCVALMIAGLTPALAESPVEPLLVFMEPSDTRDSSGILTFEANPLERRGPIKWDLGPTTADAGHELPGFIALLALESPEGGYDVFACTHQQTDQEPRTFNWQLYRGHTPDGHRLIRWKEVLRNPEGPWLIESMAVRQATTGRLFFFTWSRSTEPQKGHAVWGFVSPDGEAWQSLSDEPLYLEHDAFGGMWDDRTGRLVIGQVTQQAFRKPFSDNIGQDRRRVLSVRTSKDGAHWDRLAEAGSDGLITPDAKDSPDVEFYRMHPFAYADRYIAMVDLYAASPLTPARHGPHLACEWWVSDDGIRWQRPWRDLDARAGAGYPIKMAPIWLGGEMLFWVQGQVWGLREYRIASVGARSNAEFSSRLFQMPAEPLLLNAAIPAGEGLFNQAYVAVELLDEAGRVIPGYERDHCLLRGLDDNRITLRWGDRLGVELAGRTVSLRFHLRSARIYALTTLPG